MTISATASSVRTSPSRGSPTTTSASAIATASAMPLFEVTGPGVTCYRVGIRMNEPAMPTLLVSRRRPGFYSRVLEEGLVQAGNKIEKVADGPERLTVADVDGLLYLPDQLARAARTRAARASAKRRLAGQLPRPPRQGRWRRADSTRLERVCRAVAPSRGSGGETTVAAFLLVPSWDHAPTPVAWRPAGLTSPCGCEQTAIRSSWSAATRCRTSPTPAATGSASNARARAVATCTNGSRSATSWTLCGSARDLRIAGRGPARSC